MNTGRFGQLPPASGAEAVFAPSPLFVEQPIPASPGQAQHVARAVVALHRPHDADPDPDRTRAMTAYLMTKDAPFLGGLAERLAGLGSPVELPAGEVAGPILAEVQQ